MSDNATQTFSLSLEQVDNYEFRVRFDGTEIADLTTDEPPPLGGDAGPNPTRMLATAVANCLGSSLLFALRKFKNEPARLKVTATTHLVRNEDRRWRVGKVDVDLHLGESADDLNQLERILDQFESFCVVTQSVREGIEVDVKVHDATGRKLR